MFDLPKTTLVKKVIPKNAFDSYTSAKQKKLFTERLLRITWINKLSTDTINLQGKDVVEIQIFEIELKEKSDVRTILEVIDKSIPYTIIFVVRFENFFYLSTSVKHLNPHNIDNAVIDYTFTSNWFLNEENTFTINLKNNLDWSYKNFCEQFKQALNKTEKIEELVNYHKEKDSTEKEITKLKTAISNCKQFNKKVILNLKLKDLLNKLRA